MNNKEQLLKIVDQELSSIQAIVDFLERKSNELVETSYWMDGVWLYKAACLLRERL